MSTSPSTTTAPRFSPRWWVEDDQGRVVVAQFPNPAIAVWLVTVVVGWIGFLDSEHADRVRWAGAGALVVWAVDEVVRGSSPVRRVLGAVVLVFQLVQLLS